VERRLHGQATLDCATGHSGKVFVPRRPKSKQRIARKFDDIATVDGNEVNESPEVSVEQLA
jgi:hypothetical protein